MNSGSTELSGASIFILSVFYDKNGITILIPSTCEYDVTWKYSLSRCNQVKRQSYWNTVDSKSNTTGSHMRGEETQTQREWHVTAGAEWE